MKKYTIHDNSLPPCMKFKMDIFYVLQQLLLLPELSNIAITSDGSDPLKTTSRLCSPNVTPTLELVNEELINLSGRHESLPTELVSARLSVNSLTASWTHVKIMIIISVILIFLIFRTKRNLF